MTNLWKVTDGMTEPERVQVCVPISDLDPTEYFIFPEDAWERLKAGAHAGILLAARGVDRAREELRRAERQAADMVVEFRQIETNLEAWNRSRTASRTTITDMPASENSSVSEINQQVKEK